MIVGFLILGILLIVDWKNAGKEKTEGLMLFLRFILTCVALKICGASLFLSLLVGGVWSFIGGVIFSIIGENREDNLSTSNSSSTRISASSKKIDEKDNIYLIEENCRNAPLKAKQALTRMADAGSADAMYMLGELHYYGIGVDVDKKTAEEYYLKAHKLGNHEATYTLGYMYVKGDGVVEDDKKGIELLKQAAAQNNAKAYRRLGFTYFDHPNVAQDFALSFKYMLRGAELGDGDSQAHIAQAYEGNMWGAPKRDIKLAEHYYNKAIQQKNNHAFWCLGKNYLLGINGCDQDHKKAFGYFKEAAERESDKGCLSLSLCYLRGTGTVQNQTQGVKWMKKSADLNNEEAYIRYGMLMASGAVDNSAQQCEDGRKIVLDAAIDHPDDDTVQSAAKKIYELEKEHGSWMDAVENGSARVLVECAAAPIYIEKKDLEIARLEKLADSCARVAIATWRINAYKNMLCGAWDDCYEEANKAVSKIAELNWPNEKDDLNLREFYAYLGVASFKMCVEYGVHTFAEAKQYFNKAKPFQGDSSEVIIPYYEEFIKGKQRPAQERGIVGRIDILFFNKKYDEAFKLVDQLSDSDLFKLNIYTRSMMGGILLGEHPLGDVLLESVVRDDVYKIKSNSVYAIDKALIYYYDSYRNSYSHNREGLDKWVNILKDADESVMRIIMGRLKESEQDNAELIRLIQN